jgi:hypothetical protein
MFIAGMRMQKLKKLIEYEPEAEESKIGSWSQ